MSIGNNYNNTSNDEAKVAACDYGLICFQIEYLKEKNIEISEDLKVSKLELENKLKQLLHA